MVLHFDTESADVNVIWRQNQYSQFSAPRKVLSYQLYFVIRNLIGS